MPTARDPQAEISSSDDEFYDIGDDPWFEQYDTEEEEEDAKQANIQAPEAPATPRQARFGTNYMPQPNTAPANGPASNGNRQNDSRNNGTSSSSSRGPSTPKVNTNINRGAETEDDDINSLRNEFEGLHTNDTPTRPLGRAATEPLIGSPLDSPERRARRRRIEEAILSSTETSQPASPSPTGSPRTYAPPRASNGSNLFRSSTMPVPVPHPEPMATPPLPRSRSMQNPDTTSRASPSTDVPDGYVVIAHDKAAQDIMDSLLIPWSVQYEIARGVSMGFWAWDDVTRDKLRPLPMRRWSAAQRVGEVFGRPLGGQKPEIWAELEREQKAIVEDATRGLGLMGDWEGETNWYGGRVQQIARLVKEDGKFTLQLAPMQKVKLPSDAVYKEGIMGELKELLSNKFILCGRVFEAFSVKDEKVYLVETDENYQRRPKGSDGDGYRYSLRTLIEWYNPLGLNSKQTLSKYAARADLAMSTSVPVLEFSPESIFKIDDACAPHSGGGKVPTEKIFTDGCGFMNGAALMKIGSWMGFGAPPTAVQGRILGSKGVWLLHPTDRAPDAEPKIWIRPSQTKIHLVPPAAFGARALERLHRAHRVFDLVNPSRSTVPARLSRLTIVNLQYNGVPTHILVDLMERGLREEVAALTQWRGASAMPLLWNAVNKASAVSFQRLRRSAAGIQRALGLTRRRNEDDSDDEDGLEAPPGAAPADSDAPDEEGAAIPRDGVDVPPAAMAEAIIERIQAGFTPLKDYYLYDDLKALLKQVMKSYIKEYHIIVPESAESFIVPDPFGVLEENEIHFKSSQDLKDGCLHLNPKSVTGEVLIYRNPARVPSDVQKVTAVCRSELADYVDVIVLPTKGARSLANLLAGGDVDGDVAVCIFDQDIVQAFRPPPITDEPTQFLSKYFEPMDKVPTVESVVQEMAAHPSEADDRLRRHLLIGLSESKVGKYSMFHENAIYMRGYNDPITIRLAYMFTTVLDSRKTGLIVRPSILQADQKQTCRKPVCLGGDEGADNLPRRPDDKLGPFVLEELLAAGRHIQDALLATYEENGSTLVQRGVDPDLLRPWRDIEEALRARTLPDTLKTEVEVLREHVARVRREWGMLWGSAARRPTGGGANAARQRKQREQKQKNELAMLYAQVPEGCRTLALLSDVARLKASYMYSLNPRIALAFGFQALCKIKAETAGSAAFTREFAEAMSISGAEVRVRSQFNTVDNFE